MEGRAMGDHSEVFVAFDTATLKHSVAIAEAGDEREVRFLGEIENRPATIERVIGKLARRYKKLQVCFEAGPTEYGLYRQMQALGRDCCAKRDPNGDVALTQNGLEYPQDHALVTAPEW
jgi:hypothetical protein